MEKSPTTETKTSEEEDGRVGERAIEQEFRTAGILLLGERVIEDPHTIELTVAHQSDTEDTWRGRGNTRYNALVSVRTEAVSRGLIKLNP